MARTRRELLSGARGDGAVLRRLLELQGESLFAYETALRGGRLDRPAAQLARTFRDQEREHIEGLRNALKRHGGTERSYRSGDSPPARGFPAYAVRLEARNVRAAYEAIGTIRNEKLLPGVGSIMASDAQHLTMWRELLGRDPVPEAFETGAQVD